MRLAIAGGGTGGHIYPALVVVGGLESADPPEAVLWIGCRGGIEEELVPQAGVQLVTVRGAGLHGVGWRLPLNALQLVRGTWEAWRQVRRFRPSVLLLTGGFASAPAAVAAWLQRIPILIYLPDIEPGLAIKVLSRLAKRVAATVSDSQAFLPEGKVFATGYPVRPELWRATWTDGIAHFKLEAHRRTLLVLGGSRGARSINRALMAVLEPLLAEVQVIHISGQLDWEEVRARREALPGQLRSRYHAFPYLHAEIGLAMAVADLAVARAGAATLGEFPACRLPAILVPYPYAWRYQKVNADYLVERGAAIRMNDEEMGEKLLPTLRELLADEVRLARMAEAARSLARPDAARWIGEALRELAKDRG